VASNGPRYDKEPEKEVADRGITLILEDLRDLSFDIQIKYR